MIELLSEYFERKRLELRMGAEEGIEILPDKILLKIFSYLPHKVFRLSLQSLETVKMFVIHSVHRRRACES